MIEIPLNSSPEQLFSITLNGITYDARVILNSRTGIWTIDLLIDGVEIISGVPLLGGVDIFAQHNLPISNAYVVNLEKPNQDPKEEGLGVSSKLFILTDEEVENG